jgi:anaerobic dimethyl sulfoxide reductase subunit B (iron-sulfur subunit)
MKIQYGFAINTDRCVQCHACEVACKSWNGVEPGVRWRRVLDIWEGEFPEVRNRTVSYSCMHCAKPSCIQACPEKAISKRKQDGIVVVNRSQCVGCRTCAHACPFHVPQHGRNGVMQKCNMCLERLEQGKQPICVETCPGEALKFGTLEDLAAVFPAKPAARLSARAGPAFFIAGGLTGTVFLKLMNSIR